MPEPDRLGSYIIKGGEQGRARLSVLAGVLAPTTRALFDRFEPLAGELAIDAGCGGGDVSVEIAGRVGPGGRVVAFDLDEAKLAAARHAAAQRGLGNVEFVGASVVEPWPAAAAGFVYVRFVLTHLVEPEALLARARQAMRPGGVIVVEDIDFGGLFCDPPCPAFERSNALYVAAAELRGADPFIGRRLIRLLEDAGFVDVGASLVQPCGRRGAVKQISSLTFAAIGEAVVASGLATAADVTAIAAELQAFAARPDTTLALPRIFQAWGRQP